MTNLKNEYPTTLIYIFSSISFGFGFLLAGISISAYVFEQLTFLQSETFVVIGLIVMIISLCLKIDEEAIYKKIRL